MYMLLYGHLVIASPFLRYTVETNAMQFHAETNKPTKQRCMQITPDVCMRLILLNFAMTFLYAEVLI